MKNLEHEVKNALVMNNRKFKRVEELNREVNIEPTAEEKTPAFKDWVTEKISICEKFLATKMHNLDYSLNEREPINDGMFNNKFEFVYATINRYIREAEYKCKEDGIFDEVLTDIVKEFKQMKSKVRKVKAEYKQKFAELRESIREAMENKEYVATVTNQVQELITDWCSTYVMLDYRKPDFEGDRLSKTIEYIIKWILSTKLHPSSEDVVVFVEKFMRNNTETVVC